MYEIRTYDEKYLDKHVEIGALVLDNYTGAIQTPLPMLKMTYSAPDFDPELKLYAFTNNEMVGFMTATIKQLKDSSADLTANVEFPIVLPNHLDASMILFNEMISVLKNKKVSVIQSRVSKGWGKTHELANKLDYEFKKDLVESASIMVNNDYDIEKLIEIEMQNHKDLNKTIEITHYSDEEDYVGLKQMYVDNKMLTPSEFDSQMKSMSMYKDWIVNRLVYKDKKVEAYSILWKLPRGEKIGGLSAIYAFGNLRDLLRLKVLQKIILDAKDKGFTEIMLTLNEKEFYLKQFFEKLGIKFDPILKLYTKKL